MKREGRLQIPQSSLSILADTRINQNISQFIASRIAWQAEGKDSAGHVRSLLI